MRHIFTCLWPLLIAMGAFITFTPPPVVAMPPDVVASTTSEKPVLVNEALDIDFWERAAQLGNLARKYAESRISEVQSTYPHYIEEVGTIKDGISQMVSCATGFKALIKQTSLHTARDTSNSETVSDDISSEALVDDIVDKVDKILAELLEELSAAFPPPDHATHHAEREIQVSKILGDITEQHPDLVEILLITAVFMIIPEGWILRPVARLFGIGPYGPVKGSTAAWAQRTFYGAEVKAGSCGSEDWDVYSGNVAEGPEPSSMIEPLCASRVESRNTSLKS
ncbi:predicted protein [Postia placenta Mad-698-R]|uniref:Uncharacterized protein n=1 Tax=Postia placenta MAD-698-R-SB12 TaxID=670580 RepID=A0A1X6N709_9APHY|nr:hypothetical protein POSPLADRAFT_1138415 [Postia placenta MAD-698-R-SB12]EED85598.1 predicted protein [Postia placenta Mad-698-R]OSX64405.1 hypothetical protein POSPLADRAFT_1138415 [Postia placenta MAD-698-R-SB12]